MGKRINDSTGLWYARLPARWRGDQNIARQFMRDVIAGTDESDRAYITGTFSLVLNSGHVLDDFRMRILYPVNFPLRNGHPEVYLESHRDRWKTGGDSHIEPSWRMCMFVPGESGLHFERDDELVNLFPNIHTFLILERIYQRQLQIHERNPHWPGPQRTHGIAGLIDALADSPTRLGRNDPCVCGSGKKFKSCHWDEINAAERRSRIATG